MNTRLETSHDFGGRTVFRKPWIIFLLFAINGPALSLVGQFRYSELLILLVGLLNAGPVQRSIGRMEWRLGLLFLLSALTYLIMDLFNQGIDTSTISRVGTYTILCALLFTIKWIIGNSEKRLIAALLGFSFSFIVVLILDLPVPSKNYHSLPWRLGLGYAVTLAVCTLIFCFPKIHILGLLGLATILAIHLIFNSRSLAIITLIVFLISLNARQFGYRIPGRPGIHHMWKPFAYGTVAVLGLYLFIQVLVAQSILPEEMQAKMELQMQNSYGLLAAARPDVATAIHGIVQRPLTGFGSSTVDPEVFNFYARVSAASYIGGLQDQIYRNTVNSEWSLGTPSHSHLFGAWVDAGILAALSWMAVLLLAAIVLRRVLRYRSCITPLAAFVTVALSWDVLFSPGPTRLAVALSLAVLLFVQRHLTRENQRYRQVRSHSDLLPETRSILT